MSGTDSGLSQSRGAVTVACTAIACRVAIACTAIACTTIAAVQTAPCAGAIEFTETRGAPEATDGDGVSLCSDEIGPGVFLIAGEGREPDFVNGGRTGNVLFLVGRDGILVWNAGSSYQHGRSILRAIRARSALPIRWVVLAHPVQDLLFGVRAFEEVGATVLMSVPGQALMRSRCNACLARLESQFGARAMSGSRLPDRVETVASDRTFEGLGRDVVLLSIGTAAVPGALLLLDREGSVLLAGDTVMTDRLPEIRDGQLPAWSDGLQRIAALSGAVTVVPDHGRAAPLSPSVARTSRYLRELQTLVRGMLDSDVGLLEATTRGALPEFSHMKDYALIQPRNVNALYLALEQQLDGSERTTPR